MNFNAGNNMKALFSIPEKSLKRWDKRRQNNESFRTFRIIMFSLYSAVPARTKNSCNPLAEAENVRPAAQRAAPCRQKR